MTVGLCVGLCVRVYVCVRVHVCTQRFVSENFLLRGSAPRLKSSPLPQGISFGHWLMPWQLWPLWCFVVFVVVVDSCFCFVLFRYVSSCGEQDGQTWRNTCRSGCT